MPVAKDNPALGGRAAVLDLVKRDGPVAAEDLAERLGITGMAVRQHLAALSVDGLVGSELKRGGRGRPASLWRASEKADAHFPDAHSHLAADLLVHMKKAFGDEGLDRIIRMRTAEQARAYREALSGKHTLRARLEALAAIRTREGYMADVRREAGTGAYLLVENHCPVCAAARLCTGLCREELNLFQKVLGRGARIERMSHILAGAGRCAYRIVEAK